MVAGAGLGLGRRQNQQPLAFIDGGKAMRIEHRIEQLADTFAVQFVWRQHGDPATHPRVENDGGFEDARHLVRHVAQFGIVHGQAPTGRFGNGRQGAEQAQRQ